jgi:hypothetical protein
MPSTSDPSMAPTRAGAPGHCAQRRAPGVVPRWRSLPRRWLPLVAVARAPPRGSPCRRWRPRCREPHPLVQRLSSGAPPRTPCHHRDGGAPRDPAAGTE